MYRCVNQQKNNLIKNLSQQIFILNFFLHTRLKIYQKVIYKQIMPYQNFNGIATCLLNSKNLNFRTFASAQNGESISQIYSQLCYIVKPSALFLVIYLLVTSSCCVQRTARVILYFAFIKQSGVAMCVPFAHLACNKLFFFMSFRRAHFVHKLLCIIIIITYYY